MYYLKKLYLCINLYHLNNNTMKQIILSLFCLLSCGIICAQDIYESTGDNVNVRKGPGMNYGIVMTNIARPGKVQLFKGDRVEYLGETKNGFMKINVPESKNAQQSVAWVSAQYLRKPTKGSLSALEKKVVGRHMLSLQWISWDYFGVCTITKEADGRLRCVGEQLSKETPGDYLKLDGYIEIVDAKHLIFEGDISIKVYHLNEGNEYVRTGRYDFVSTQNRKYWRAQNLEKIDATDYVDIYFK